MNEPPRSAPLELMSGRARAVVEPAGSRVRSLVVDGRDLLVAPGDDPLLWGCYPMAPWAGRLDRGRFGHDGEPIDISTHGVLPKIHPVLMNVPARDGRIELRYERPLSERVSGWISLIAWVLILAVAIRRIALVSLGHMN